MAAMIAFVSPQVATPSGAPPQSHADAIFSRGGNLGVSLAPVARALDRCSVAVVGAAALAVARAGARGHSSRQYGAGRTLGRKHWRMTAAATSELSPEESSYLALLVNTPEGKTLQIEILPSDTIKALKAMVQVESRVADNMQELTFEGKVLEDSDIISEAGLESASRIDLTVKEADSTDIEDTPVPEGCIRITVRPGPGEDDGTGCTLDVPLTNTGKELRDMIYKELGKSVDHIQKIGVDEYGVFLLESLDIDADGQVRHLTRDERIKELKTVEENGLEGGERLVFANLFFFDW